jgi:outer membrane lipoprotein-sorting protein
MIKAITLICILFYCAPGKAQYPGYTIPLNAETFKKSFAQVTAATLSIQSDFSQEKSLTMLSEKINSTGRFWYRKKDNLRMEYIRPYPYLMILHSGKILIKEGSKENEVSANSNKVFQQINRLLIDCVAGTVLNNPDFQSLIFENATSFMIELKPMAKNLKDLYKNINIVIDKKDYTASEIGMYENSGDKTIIRFQNKEINAQIPDSVFNIP